MVDHVSAGKPAPDFVYATATGATEHLAQAWQNHPALVLWLRHFG